ncbi:HAD hydrolase-like protein [Candidatus Woesearchaeota archaeon]|nr:HAD hydrolase-like protein [Candidatus Woesearchaeota archaeon]
MTDKIVMVDFAGTLVKASVIEEANEFRSKVLERGLPSIEEHAHPDELYKANREFVEKLTGLTKDLKVQYRKNDLEFMELTGEQLQNQVATNLFQIGMYMSAKKHGLSIVPEGFVEQLQRIQKAGYKLAIVSGVRTDIISGMLQIAKIPVAFDFVIGQPPILGVNNEENIKLLQEKGTVTFVIGDKLSDLEPAKGVGAKTVFVKWGHPSGGEEEFADYTIEKPEELEKIIS